MLVHVSLRLQAVETLPVPAAGQPLHVLPRYWEATAARARYSMHGAVHNVDVDEAAQTRVTRAMATRQRYRHDALVEAHLAVGGAAAIGGFLPCEVAAAAPEEAVLLCGRRGGWLLGRLSGGLLTWLVGW